MKKILIMLVIAIMPAMAFFSSPFSSPSTGSLEKPSHEYEIDTWGSNSEVYEFTPRANPNMTCIFVILDSGKSMSLQCFSKK